MTFGVDQNRGHAVLGSLVWKLAELVGATVAQLVISIVLARILTPADFGIIALVGVFIALANVFVVSGLGTALVQKKTVDSLDLSSVFFACMGISAALFASIFLLAPILADFYVRPELALVMRVLAGSMFLTPLNVVQNALVSRGMLFKRVFVNSSVATLLSGVLGVALAMGGYSLWALVAQQVSNQFLLSMLLYASVRWRPTFEFSWGRLMGILSFSWKILASGLIDSIYGQARTLIIGLVYPPGVLGFYTKGQSFPNMIVTAMDGSIQAVMLPVLSSQQDDGPTLKATMRRAMVMSSYIVFPAMAGMAAVANPLVRLLLTDKWLPAVPFLQIFCGVFALWPVHTANLQAIVALGRSDVMLRLEVIKKVIGVAVLAVTIQFGPMAMAAGLLVTGVVSTLINARPNVTLLNYRYREQVRDLAPAFLVSVLMGAAVWALNGLKLSMAAMLSLQTIAGLVIYIGGSWLLRLEPFVYAAGVAQDVLRKRRA